MRSAHNATPTSMAHQPTRWGTGSRVWSSISHVNRHLDDLRSQRPSFASAKSGRSARILRDTGVQPRGDRPAGTVTPCRCRIASRHSVTWSPIRLEGSCMGTVGACMTPTGTIRRRYAGRRWIACRLEFRGWQRGPMLQPGRFTELFFLDEATAFAAGHRPCALCRHEDYRRFVAFWRRRRPGPAGADDIDAALHGERLDPGSRRQRHHEAEMQDLPDGAFVLHHGAPHLVSGRGLLRWSPSGYAGRMPRPRGPGGDDHSSVLRRPAHGRMGGRGASRASIGR